MCIIPNTIELLYLQWWLFGITKLKDKLEYRSMTLSHSRIIISKLLLPTLCWSQVDLHTPDLWLTAYPPYAYSMWKYIKIFYLRKIELCCIRTTLTTAAYHDGFTQEIGDHLRFQISVDCSVSRFLREDLFTTCMLDFCINELFQALGGD